MSIFSASKPSAPPSSAAPSRDDPEVEAARRREIVASGKTKGAASNLLTGSVYGDVGPTGAARKLLLGA